MSEKRSLSVAFNWPDNQKTLDQHAHLASKEMKSTKKKIVRKTKQKLF
jgi:hypothetical protein